MDEGGWGHAGGVRCMALPQRVVHCTTFVHGAGRRFGGPFDALLLQRPRRSRPGARVLSP
jgi:hypothetical protein